MNLKNKIVQSAFNLIPVKFKKWIININLNQYGKMINFHLNPEKKEIYAKMLLSGENEPIELHVQDYHLVENDEGLNIVIDKFVANRQWITTLFEQFLSGKNIPIPKDKLPLIKELLATK